MSEERRWAFAYRVPENPPESQFRVTGMAYPAHWTEDDVLLAFRRWLTDHEPQAQWSTLTYASKPEDDEPVVWKSPPGARVM